MTSSRLADFLYIFVVVVAFKLLFSLYHFGRVGRQSAHVRGCVCVCVCVGGNKNNSGYLAFEPSNDGNYPSIWYVDL